MGTTATWILFCKFVELGILCSGLELEHHSFFTIARAPTSSSAAALTEEAVAKKYGWDDIYAGKQVGAP